MKSILLIGGGGHCKSVIDVIEAENKYRIIGIIDNEKKINNKVLGYNFIGTDDNLSDFIKMADYSLVTIGQIKSPLPRIKAFGLIKKLQGKIATIVSPMAYISKHSKIGEGTTVMHRATISSAVSIGSNCILNTGCFVEHDCSIGMHTHLSTGAKVNGCVIIGNRCFIGSGTVLKNGVHIGDDVVIGAGVTVKSDVPDGTVLK